MKGDDIVNIVKSPAFTIMITTICVIVVMQQIAPTVLAIKAAKRDKNF